MPDYKAMYLSLFHATEQAIDTLIAAQRECEELYLNAPDEVLTLLSQEPEEPSLSGCCHKNSRCAMQRLFL